MKELAGLIFSDEQFEMLAGYCAADPDFPKSWDAWMGLLSHANAMATAQREVCKPLELEPGHFSAWCGRLQVIPCLDALRAYAIIHRSPVATSLYGLLNLDSRPTDLDPP
ncbi:MAG: hypothetical protein ABI605_13785 [Rhizobacter sp.]